MELIIKTSRREEIIDITEKVLGLVKGKKGKAVLIYTPHTTCGVTITEGADKAVIDDLMRALNEIEPGIEYKHEEGNSPAHVKSCLIGCSVIVPVEKEKLMLGKWQRIFFLEFDGGRERKIIIKLI